MKRETGMLAECHAPGRWSVSWKVVAPRRTGPGSEAARNWLALAVAVRYGGCSRRGPGCVAPKRFGFTIIELLVTLVLLAATVGLIGTVQQKLRQGLQQVELHQRIVWELENLEQRIRGWDPDEITVANIQQQPVPDSLNRSLKGASWVAQVERINQPARAVQVTLMLRGQYGGQLLESPQHTFWTAGGEGDRQ